MSQSGATASRGAHTPHQQPTRTREEAGAEGVYSQGDLGLSGGIYLLATRSRSSRPTGGRGRGGDQQRPWHRQCWGQRHFFAGPRSHLPLGLKCSWGRLAEEWVGGSCREVMLALAPQFLGLSQGRPSPPPPRILLGHQGEAARLLHPTGMGLSPLAFQGPRALGNCWRHPISKVRRGVGRPAQ